MNTLLTALLSPLADYFTTNSAKIDKEAKSSKLFFEDFFLKIFFAFQQGIDSLCSLSEELKSNVLAQELGLHYTSFSTLKAKVMRVNYI